MKRTLFGIAVLTVVAVGACNPLAPDQSVVLYVSQLDAPTTISTGSALTVVLTVVTGGCRTFDRLEVERTAFAASVVAWGRDSSIGETNTTCPEIVVNESHSFRFEPPFGSPFKVLVPRVGTDALIATVQIQ